jgi:LysM repeat protein
MAEPEIPLPDNIPEANYEGIPADQLPSDSMADLAPLAGLPAAAAPPAADPYQRYAPAAQSSPLDQSPVEPADASGVAPLSQDSPEPSYTELGQIPGPDGPSFKGALPAINQALERGELTRAHTMLSSWYGDPNLSPTESEKVNELLSQLAGTVVYSTDHRLEPPYTVKPGDTLETIAQSYDVPWRLLAKINGVPTSNAIQAGQTLKVLRGPFNAVVDAKQNELVLMIDGKYAGKFPVTLSGAAMSEGNWRVEQKPVGGAPGPYGQPASPGKQLVLKDDSGMATLVIGAGGGSPMERGRVSVANADLDELHDILSVGSQVTIRK